MCVNKNASILPKSIPQSLKFVMLPSPASTIKILSPAFMRIHVSAVPAEGNGPLDPQSSPDKESSSGSGLGL